MKLEITNKMDFNDCNNLNKSSREEILRGRLRLIHNRAEMLRYQLEYSKTHKEEKKEYDRHYYRWRASWGKPRIADYAHYHNGKDNNLLDISMDCLD